MRLFFGKFSLILYAVVVLLLSGCQSYQNNSLDSDIKFKNVYNRALDYSLAIRKREILDNFNNEYKNATVLTNLPQLEVSINNNSYSLDDKTQLVLNSLTQAKLYNLLAFNIDKRKDIAEFYAKNEIRYRLINLIYKHQTLKQLQDEMIKYHEVDFSTEIQAQLDNIELQAIDLVGESKFLTETQIVLPSNFYEVPDDILLSSLNSQPYFPFAYNQDFINITNNIIEQMPPYSDLFVEIFKYNYLLLKAPHELYENYGDDVMIQADLSKIFTILAMRYEINLTLNNLKDIEQKYSITKNNFLLKSEFKNRDYVKELYELKLLELGRFEGYSFLLYLAGKYNVDNFIIQPNEKPQKIPNDIRFLLEKTTLDIISMHLLM